MIGAAIALVVILGVALAPGMLDGQWALVGLVALVLTSWGLRDGLRWPILVMATYLGACAMWTAAFGVGNAGGIFTVSLVVRQTLFLGLVLAGACALRDIPSQLMPGLVPAWALAAICGVNIIFQNASLNACLLVACLPFARQWWVLVLVTGVVMFRQGGGMAPLMLAFYLLLLGGRFWPWFIPAAVGLVGWKWTIARGFLDESSRFGFYRLCWTYFREQVNQWHGSGLGTFIFFGPQVQIAGQYELNAVLPLTPWWVQMHNDWGQLLFETGWVGLALGLWVYIDSLIVADRPTRQSLLLMGMCGVGYFPMQVPIMAFVCVWLAARAQRRIDV